MGGEIETSQAEVDRKALEDLVVGNEDLERLETLASGLQAERPGAVAPGVAQPSARRAVGSVSEPLCVFDLPS
jgi:hypothetical protein